MGLLLIATSVFLPMAVNGSLLSYYTKSSSSLSRDRSISHESALYSVTSPDLFVYDSRPADAIGLRVSFSTLLNCNENNASHHELPGGGP